jgi:hypothetical protein
VCYSIDIFEIMHERGIEHSPTVVTDHQSHTGFFGSRSAYCTTEQALIIIMYASMLSSRVVARCGYHLGRGLSNRASAILSSLDISTSKELPGVYDGTWKGSGEVLRSVCPTTGEILGFIRSVSPFIFLSLALSDVSLGHTSGTARHSGKVPRSIPVLPRCASPP